MISAALEASATVATFKPASSAFFQDFEPSYNPTITLTPLS